ncbi:MAG: serine/threonine-protein kinase [Xenococcaceae cyanobacterium MO_207.B15]|nr:serine/threonine-protein kinase [Xenococcaceae cyanobacterium MO_207.B15]
MALLVGRGKYLLQEEIGRGISGITYKAINQTNNQVVVIKTFASVSSQEDEASDIRKKFLYEARRLLECSHPNIIPYREFFSEDGVPYIVMNYIPGKTLDKIVLPNSPLPEATAIKYIQQVGNALKVVHDHGFLHRDVKPQNLILCEDTQQVVLIDFGIAREFSRGLVQTHTSLVSDGYAPIEQYLPKAERTQATDIYGLAATLYTLVTAQIPISATLRDHLILNTPQQIRPELSDKISQAIMKGMALELEERPSSVDEWLALLPETSGNGITELPITPEPKMETESIDSNSLVLDSEEMVEVVEQTSVQQPDKQNQLWKIIAIGLLIFLGLDYIILKMSDRFKDAPSQPNVTEQRLL